MTGVGLVEGAVNAELDAADGQQVDPGFGFAGLDLVADPELPFPDARSRCRHDGIFDAPVVQVYSSEDGRLAGFSVL